MTLSIYPLGSNNYEPNFQNQNQFSERNNVNESHKKLEKVIKGVRQEKIKKEK